MVFEMTKKRNCVQIPFLLKVRYHGYWYEKEEELCPNPLSSVRLNIMVTFGMKMKWNCVQIPFLCKVKYHGFWYEKEKELCPNTLSS